MQIYECIYEKDQKVSDSQVSALVINNEHPERRELQAYVQAYRQGLHRLHHLTAVFSPKFALKAGMDVATFKRFCEQNKDVDVCHINPFPHLRYWTYNVWESGECFHPGLTTRSQALLDAVGIPLQLSETPRHGARYLAYCNFWAGTELFWDNYVGGVLVPISDFLDAEPEHPAVRAIMTNTQHTQASPYLPFMIERLYSTWISIHLELRVADFPISEEEVVSKYASTDFNRLLIRQMREMVDQCDTAGAFPPQVRQRMADMSALYRQHLFDYYEHRPHPHTGQPIVRIAR